MKLIKKKENEREYRVTNNFREKLNDYKNFKYHRKIELVRSISEFQSNERTQRESSDWRENEVSSMEN